MEAYNVITFVTGTSSEAIIFNHMFTLMIISSLVALGINILVRILTRS